MGKKMFLKTIAIKNFRGIESVTLQLDEVCVLIGENNSGKTTILDALKICLTRSMTRRGAIFDEYDYHLPSASKSPSDAPPIEITLTFAERTKDEWPDEISQLLDAAEQVDGEGLRSVTLFIKSEYDATVGDFSTTYEFLNLAGAALPKAKNPRTIINMQQLAPTFYLASLRDAAQEFKAKSQFWGPFVRSLNLKAEDQAELEAALSKLNAQILDKHEAFANVKERLKQTADILPMGATDPVAIDAVPTKVFDILSRAQVSLAAKTGARIPIVRHGNGTQSLAVICLFDAFLQARLKDAYTEFSEPILALEEPEAHLHPSATKAVGTLLQSLIGQKIISTHSGDILSSIPISKVRRLRRRDGKICVHQVTPGAIGADDMAKLDYHVRAMRGSLLLARAWLLVEGETEGTLLPECARVMGIDLDAEGISVVEFTKVGVAKFISLADQLGIEWFVLADNDTAGNAYAASATAALNGRESANHIRVLDVGTMDVFLCNSGFGSIYEATISNQKRVSITAQQGTAQYWEQVVDAQERGAKTKNSLLVAEDIVKKGVGSVPKALKETVDAVVKAARATA